MKTSCSTGRRSFRLLSALILAVVLSTHFLSAQGWYDADWSYRSQAAVSHPLGVTGSTLTGYQVKINLTGGVGGNFDFTKALSDGSDIRFTAADGITLIPFWIESYDATGLTATIWVKVPSIPTAGTTVYVYYGNASPTLPSQNPVKTPPIGPFTRAAGNPIFANTPQASLSLLAENIVYDPVSQHYWMVFANYSTAGVGLAWSNNPADPASWNWHGNVYNHGSGGSFAPHILYENGLWYIFFAQLPNIVYMTCSTINGTYSAPTVALSPTLAWEAYRVDEPYVFERGENDWVMIYMGDAGGITEQVGYATATSITGPYTPYAGNPCIPFGPAGSYDAGTVADPWVYNFNGVYYIGYTVSPSKSSPWYTACATTTDWTTFTKIGVILPVGSGLDAANSFRGALTRIGNEYVFSYTNDSYRMAIATQPVYGTLPNIVNNPDAVFEFYDGFNTADGSDPDLTKWTFTSGNATQTNIAGGFLTMTATGTYVKIDGLTFVGIGYVGETYARHPNQGVNNMIMEAGFMQGAFSNALRIADDFPSITNWQRQNKTSVTGDIWVNMQQTSDQGWNTFRVYRESSGSAGFQIGNNPIETVTADVPTLPMAPFLMSYGSGNQFIIDWTRVRKWAGAEPVIIVSSEEAINIWTGDGGTSWNNLTSWSAGHVPTSTENAAINDVENDPVISGGIFECNSLVIDPGARLTIASTGGLDVAGLITINSSSIASTGSLINYGSIDGIVLFNRFLRPENTMGSRHYFSSPVGGMTIPSFLAANLNLEQLWEYNESSNSWQTAVSGNLLSGKGYNLAQTTLSLGEYSFRGSVVSTATFIATAPYVSTHTSRTSPLDYGYLNPDLTIWSAGRTWDNYGGGGWNLMGNPFTSAMIASSFITANSDLFDPNYRALYVYDGINNVYRYAAASAPLSPEAGDFGNFVQAGQGFFVLALYNGATFTFNSTMQVHQPAVSILKSAEANDDPWPGLQLRLKYGEKERETSIVFNEAMTTGSDPGYDVGQMSTNPEFELYTVLVAGDNSVNFARQALPLTDAEKHAIPVGIDTRTGGEVTFSAFTVPLGGNRFWLEDRSTGTFTDLMTKSYTVTIPANTFGSGRFYIVASANTPTSVKHPDSYDADLRIWASGGKIIVKGDVGDKAFCELYDLRGKTLVESRLDNNELNIIDLPENLHGVFIVRVVDGIKVTTRKVALL